MTLKQDKTNTVAPGEPHVEDRMVKISAAVAALPTGDAVERMQQESVDLMALLSDREDRQDEEQEAGSVLPRKLERAVQRELVAYR